MIYLTGDTHGRFGRIQDFCEEYETTKEDLLVILGDVGVNYDGSHYDERLKERLSSWPVTFFFVRGNHEENPENLSTYQEHPYKEGSVLIEEDYPNLLFAKDGEVYSFNIDGKNKRTLVIGGAYSVDKYYRLRRGLKWFPDEQPSDEVKKKVEKRLSEMNWKIDYVLTHTAPIRYEPREWFIPGIDENTVDKSTEEWLDEIYGKLTFDKWYCGHYHGEKNVNKLRFMYEGVKLLGE